jgi:HlyD family secretion protein
MKSIKIFIITICVTTLFACNNDKNKLDASGTFEATEIIISSEASGRIMEFNITEGDILKENQVIGYIDTLQLYYKKRQLESTYKTILSRKPDVNVQIASMEEQIRNLKSEKIRFEKLVKSNAGNQKQVDDIDAQILLLEKQINAQKSSLRINTDALDNESEGVAMQLEQLKDQMEKSKIFSPINGTVLIKFAEKGEITQAGKALFKMADTENMIFKAYVTADQFNQIKIGQKVKVFADFSKDESREYEGTITWVSDKSEFTPKTIQTKDERANLVYAVKMKVKNDGYLKIGMYGQIKF